MGSSFPPWACESESRFRPWRRFRHPGRPVVWLSWLFRPCLFLRIFFLLQSFSQVLWALRRCVRWLPWAFRFVPWFPWWFVVVRVFPPFRYPGAFPIGSHQGGSFSVLWWGVAFAESCSNWLTMGQVVGFEMLIGSGSIGWHLWTRWLCGWWAIPVGCRMTVIGCRLMIIVIVIDAGTRLVVVRIIMTGPLDYRSKSCFQFSLCCY